MRPWPLGLTAALLLPLPASAQSAYLNALAARPLGPATMSGRITSLAVVERRPLTQYVGSAGGGVWKTTDNGQTWKPVFEGRPSPSVGDLAVAPSDPNVVWVGTGEANARNSVSWGDGVYRSSDAGKTWEYRGLRATRHIGRVVIHPRDPDTVYVAALGRLWGPSRERGVFKTGDGGKTWQHVLALGPDTGCVDLAIDPTEPRTLYAAAYRVRRGPFAGNDPAVQLGPRAGLYRTRDAGKTWIRLTRGLPTRPMGRCGLAVWRKDPRVLYAVIQTDRTDLSRISGQPARTNTFAETGGVFRSRDRGETWVKVNDLCPRPFYFGQIRIDPGDERRLYVLGIPLYVSRDAGRTFRPDGARKVHVDHHALWINPANTDHLLLGGDGGLYSSLDRGAHWEHFKNLPLAQFYGVALDSRRPYRVYGGLQDHGTWGGPSRGPTPAGITVDDWTRILDFDGFRCQVDPADPDTVYAEGQFGKLHRVDVRTGRRVPIRPRPAPRAPGYRFNWDAPVFLSPHGNRTLYFGGNHLFRSANRGDTWQVISPDLTLGQPGPSRHTGHTLTAISESPLRPGVLFVGTDDGLVHVSRDAGRTWADVSARVPGVSAERWVTGVECSPFAAGTAYLSLDRHRQDDRAPYLFKTEDFGATWKPLANNLPRGGPVLVVRADARNRDLLFAGTEFGLFASLDGGTNWLPVRGLPPAAVHDLAVHPRDRELVIATHGRGLFVLDIAPLQELSARVLAAPAHLFDVKPATLWRPRPARPTPVRSYVAPNPPEGALLSYALKVKAAPALRLAVVDSAGRAVVELPTPPGPGCTRSTGTCAARAAAGCRRGSTPSGSRLASRC